MFGRQPSRRSPADSLSRRQALQAASAGFGYLALAGLLGRTNGAGRDGFEHDASASPLAPKPPHFPAKAKRIIFLFMQGAMSQMDTWEYKPQLQADDGKVGPGGGTLVGVEVQVRASTARPAPGSRSCSRTWPSTSTSSASSAACTPTRRPIPRRSCSCTPARRSPRSPGRRWAPGCCTAWAPRTRICPATSRSTRRRTSAARPTTAARSCRPTSRARGSTTPATCRTCRPQTAAALQRKQLDLIQAMNRDLAAAPGAPDQLDGVIESYELAFKMQGKVPELLDISKEPQHGARRLRREARPGRQLRPAVPDGPAAERGGRALRRDLPARLGPPQQPAQGPDRQLRRHRSADRRPAGRPGAARPARRDAGAVRQRVRPHADRRRAPTAAITTSPATRCGWPAPA